MIVSAVILSWLVDKPVPLKPLLVSKLNNRRTDRARTVVLAALGFGFNAMSGHGALGVGCNLDLAVHCLLRPRVGAPYERDGNEPLSRGDLSDWVAGGDDPMMHDRHHVMFWVVTLLVLAALLWLLSDVLLPFVGGIALAYLLSPIADRMERIGINRTVAALLIVTGIVVALIAVVVLVVPLLVHQAPPSSPASPSISNVSRSSSSIRACPG